MNYIKRLIISLLSIVLIITSNLSFAFATDEWDKKYKYDKGGVVVAGTKGDLISRIKIPSSASKIGKFIGKGGHNALIGLALTEMLGKAVDYVLDPDNNTIRYKQKTSADGHEYIIASKSFDSAESACDYVWSDAFLKSQNLKKARLAYDITNKAKRGQYYFQLYWLDNNDYIFNCRVNAVSLDTVGEFHNLMHDFTGRKYYKGEVKEISMPVANLAEHIQDNAETNKDYRKLLEEVVKQMGRDKELEKDLDKNARKKDKDDVKTCPKGYKLDIFTLLCIAEIVDAITDDEPNNPNHNDGDKDCNKCTILREIEHNTQQTAQNTEQIAENTKSIKDKIDGLLDWLKDDNIDKQDGQVDVKDLAKDLKIDPNRIKIAQNQCPPPKQITVNVGLVTQTYEYSYQPMCDFFAKLRPFVIATASLSAILIIGGIRRG